MMSVVKTRARQRLNTCWKKERNRTLGRTLGRTICRTKSWPHIVCPNKTLKGNCLLIYVATALERWANSRHTHTAESFCPTDSILCQNKLISIFFGWNDFDNQNEAGKVFSRDDRFLRCRHQLEACVVDNTSSVSRFQMAAKPRRANGRGKPLAACYLM